MILQKIHAAKVKPITLGALAKIVQAECQGDPQVLITGVGTLANAKSGQLTFLAGGAKYKSALANTQATAVVLSANDVQDCPVSALICDDPKLAFAKIVTLLHPYQPIASGIHPKATIGSNTTIDPESSIGPNCVIGDHVVIGKNVVLGAGCVISDHCRIEADTLLHPNVTVYHGSQIGRHCVIHSGVVIGSDGFGFANHQGRWIKVPQVGNVIIGDHVEIGANTTIDRGAIEDTEIGNHVILDNLIQIGHNVKIGEGTAIAACSGIAGSTTVGKHCLIGGGSRINGHIEITDNVTLVGCTNVAKSIKTPGVYASGINENDFKTWKRNLARFHQLDDLASRLIQLEKHTTVREER